MYIISNIYIRIEIEVTIQSREEDVTITRFFMSAFNLDKRDNCEKNRVFSKRPIQIRIERNHG